MVIEQIRTRIAAIKRNGYKRNTIQRLDDVQF